jgi:hypothetical protein
MWYTQRLDPIQDRMFQGIVLIVPNDCPTETGRVFCCQKRFIREDVPG